MDLKEMTAEMERLANELGNQEYYVLMAPLEGKGENGCPCVKVVFAKSLDDAKNVATEAGKSDGCVPHALFDPQTAVRLAYGIMKEGLKSTPAYTLLALIRLAGNREP